MKHYTEVYSRHPGGCLYLIIIQAFPAFVAFFVFFILFSALSNLFSGTCAPNIALFAYGAINLGSAIIKTFITLKVSKEFEFGVIFDAASHEAKQKDRKLTLHRLIPLDILFALIIILTAFVVTWHFLACASA